MSANQITIRVQPDEAIFLKINSHVPGLELKTDALDLDMSYRGKQIPEAYETLLLDALEGNYSRRVRADEVDMGWAVFTPLLGYLEEERVVPRGYAYGKLSVFIIASPNTHIPRLYRTTRTGGVHRDVLSPAKQTDGIAWQSSPVTTPPRQR